MQHPRLTASVGGGVAWRQEVDDSSGAGIKTRDGHAFVLKGYSSLFFITGAASSELKSAGRPRGCQKQTDKQQRQGETMQTWSPQKCQLTAAAEWGREYHWQPNRVKCPTRRTARGGRANARTAAEMSRKMEPARPWRVPLQRLGASARAVRREADADGKVEWCCPSWPEQLCLVWCAVTRVHRDAARGTARPRPLLSTLV